VFTDAGADVLVSFTKYRAFLFEQGNLRFQVRNFRWLYLALCDQTKFNESHWYLGWRCTGAHETLNFLICLILVGILIQDILLSLVPTELMSRRRANIDNRAVRDELDDTTALDTGNNRSMERTASVAGSVAISLFDYTSMVSLVLGGCCT